MGSPGAAPAAAKPDASVALGVGTVREERGASFSPAALAPALRCAAPTFVADGSGSIASLPAGVWATQWRVGLWDATPPLVHGLRPGAEGIFGGQTSRDGGWTAPPPGVAQLAWSAPPWGVGRGA